METLLRFLSTYKTFIVFMLLEVFSLTLVGKYNTYQHGKMLNSSNAIVGQVYDGISSMTDYLSLGETNHDLARENSRLKSELNVTKRALEFFREDSTYALRQKIARQNGYTFVTARVINSSFSRSHNYLTLDKGTLDGVHAEMGVVSHSGVVGIVSTASEHFALVIPVLNVVSRISAKVKDKSQTGSLVWKGGDYRYAALEEVPGFIPVAKGDSIITSGHSTIFPEGVYVGKVSKCGRGEDNNVKIEVELGVDFTKLAYVDVINYGNAEEMKELLKKAQENE